MDGGNDVNRCCQILQAEKIISVLGNHERWLLNNQMRQLKNATSLDNLTKKSQSFLKYLPTTFEFSTSQGLGLLCHGLDKNDMAMVKPDDYGYAIEVNYDLQKLIKEQKYKYMINGHSHCPMVRSFQDLTIINAGTLKKEHHPGFVTINFHASYVSFYKFIAQNRIEIEKIIDL